MTEAGANNTGNRRVAISKTQRATEAGAELLSLCQTATADGSLSDAEVESLREWLRSQSSSDLPAVPFLFPVVERIVADGVVTPEERRELFLAIEKILPQDVREMSRSARQANEQAEKAQRKLDAEEARQKQREERELNRPLEHFDFMVAGAKFDGRPALIARHARIDDPVLLQRDLQNRYSRSATKVLTADGHDIGFVPEEDAKVLAPLLDAGHRYAARIKKVFSGSSHDIPVIVADIYRHGSAVPFAAPALVGQAAQQPASIEVPASYSRFTKAIVTIVVVGLLFAAAKACSG